MDFVCVSQCVLVHVCMYTYICMPMFMYIYNAHLHMDNVIIYSVLLCINKLYIIVFTLVGVKSLLHGILSIVLLLGNSDTE